MSEQERSLRKSRDGFVVSDKMDKTLVVRVDRRVAHPLYGKIVTRSKKYHVHDEENAGSVGDFVRIAESRPYSKLKRWRLQSVIRKAEA